jgi:probable HAF family extracellular repeat protein
MTRPNPCFLAAIGLTTSAALAQTTITRYEVVDLGAAAGASTVCPCFTNNDINESGEAAGFFFGTDGTYNAFAFTNGAMDDISAPGDNRAFGRGINDLGWVVGWTDFFSVQHAFLHDGTDLIDLGTLGGTYSDANDVNNAGQVVGDASTPFPEDDSHAAVWQDGAWTDLGTLGGPLSEAMAINEAGMIVGWSWNAEWDAKAVYWNPDLTGPFELPSFSTLRRFTYADDVNEAGVIVGRVEIEPFEAGPSWRAARWVDGEVEDLGLLPEAGEGENQYLLTPHTSTMARAVNDAGVIVGLSLPQSDTPLRPGPFIYKNATMTNLNDLLVEGFATPWIINDVSSINDSGTIGATARTVEDHHSKAVLLVPVELLLGDLDVNGVVNFADLLVMLGVWGDCQGCLADLNGDRVVNFADVLALIGNWG